MVNFGFSSETGHKYENYSYQSHAGTIGAVSIFNSIVLVILLAPGKFQNVEFWFFSECSKISNYLKNSNISTIIIKKALFYKKAPPLFVPDLEQGGAFL